MCACGVVTSERWLERSKLKWSFSGCVQHISFKFTIYSSNIYVLRDQLNRGRQLNPCWLAVPSGTNDILCFPRAVLGADGRELGGGIRWFADLFFANRFSVVFLCGWNRCGVGGGPMLVWRGKPCSIMPLLGNCELDLEPSAGMNRDVAGTIADWPWLRPWWRASLCSWLVFWKVFGLVCGGSVGTYAYCLTHFSKYMRLPTFNLSLTRVIYLKLAAPSVNWRNRLDLDSLVHIHGIDRVGYVAHVMIALEVVVVQEPELVYSDLRV